MSTDSADRLNQISQELASILEARLQELNLAMRAAETTTRQIVTAELDLARYRQIYESAQPELESLRVETTALKAQGDQLKQEQAQLTAERNLTRDSVRRLEETNEAMRQENQALQARARLLEENVAQMRKLKEQLMAGISGLSQEMTNLTLGTKG